MELTEEIIHKIEKMITDEMVRTKTPGLSIAIIEGEKIVYSNGFGARDLKGDKPATQDTFYLIASTTKSFICVAIMKLQEEGKLSIEDPVSKHLPFELGLDGYPILIRHLMSHQSGVPSLDDNIALSEFAKEMDYQFSFPSIPYTSWGDYFRFINSGNEFVLEPPGKKFHYLNTGFTMLGRIIEVVSGQPLTDFMGEHILSPLEMKKSSFLEEDFKNDDSLSLAYKTISKNKKQFIQEARYVSDKFGYAAGGLFCSVVEMANYTIMNLNGGIFNGKQIISKESLNQIHDFQFTESYPSTDMTEFYGNYGKTGYGFGWAVHDDFYGHKLIHHSGSWLGASAWHALIPELKLGVVMLANKHPSPRIFAQAIMMLLIGRDPEKEFHLLKNRNHQQKLSGKYESFAGVSKLKIYSEGGIMYFENSAGLAKTPLFPIDGNEGNFEIMDYYFPSEIGGRNAVQFEFRGGNTWFRIERDIFKKIRDLDLDE